MACPVTKGMQKAWRNRCKTRSAARTKRFMKRRANSIARTAIRIQLRAGAEDIVSPAALYTERSVT